MKNSLILFSLFVFFSCTKFGKNITVNGKVINPITGQGLPNLEVSLQRSKLFGFPSSGVKTLKTTTTNSEGYFNIDALNHSHYDYVVRVNTGGLYDLGWYHDGEYKGTDTYGVDVGKVTNVDFHAVPYGKLKSNVNNISCEGPTDTLNIYFKYRLKINNPIFQPGEIYGCFTNSSTSSSIPMGFYDVTWTVTKPSTGTNTFTGEVFVPENGIGEITINY